MVQTCWASLALTYLFEHDEGAHRQSGEQGRDQQHDDAHWDAGVETNEGQDPATGGGGKKSISNGHRKSISTHNSNMLRCSGKNRHKKESPCSPASDADGLQDVDAELADVDEEKDKEAERTVAPVVEKKKKMVRKSQRYFISFLK